MSDLTKYLEKEWGSLVGATLVKVRNATAEEAQELGWDISDHEPIPFLEFDNGEGLCLSQDPEGNGPGLPSYLLKTIYEGEKMMFDIGFGLPTYLAHILLGWSLYPLAQYCCY